MEKRIPTKTQTKSHRKLTESDYRDGCQQSPASFPQEV